MCTIWLNGERLGQTEDCHLGYELQRRRQAQSGARTLCCCSSGRPGSKESGGATHRACTSPAHTWAFRLPSIRKPAYSFFWDWGPQIPVSGVFRPVYLKSFDQAEIGDVYIHYNIVGKMVNGAVEVSARGEGMRRATLRLAGQEWSAQFAGDKAVVAFTLDDAQLWYPNGEGEPHLYDVEVTLSDGDKALDSRQQRIGFRTIEVLRDKRADGRGERFVFKVNGKEIFCRGYNWIPVDNAIPRGYDKLYRGNLDLAKAGNVNMLRVWGGGYYEDDQFYRLCDERGIMVWQDGAFACSLYPDTDPAFMALVKNELTYNIKRLRNCTSLAIWCGENENHWGYDDWWKAENKFAHFYGGDIYGKLFPDLVKQLDPDRFYWNGSPYSEPAGKRANDEASGDTHYWDLHSNCGGLLRIPGQCAELRQRDWRPVAARPCVRRSPLAVLRIGTSSRLSSTHATSTRTRPRMTAS